MRYGDLWRTNRRLFHRFFNVSVASQFDDKIYKAVDVFLRRLAGSPERFLKHIHLYVRPHSTIVLSPAHACLVGKPYWVIDLVGCVRGEHRV